MAGRGRGLGGMRGELDRTPLRRPNKLNNPVSNILTKQLNQLNLSEPIREDILDIVSLIKTVSTTEEDMKAACSKIYTYSLQSKKHVLIGVELCKDLINFQVNNVNFRSVLLHTLQNDFKEREKLSSDSKTFVCRITFLCEVFHKVRLQNSSPIQCLAIAVIAYLEMLLDANEDETEVLVEQLMKNGKDLEICAKENLHELYLKIRERITYPSLNESSRTLLLASLEYFLNGWKEFTPELKSFYEGLSGHKIVF